MKWTPLLVAGLALTACGSDGDTSTVDVPSASDDSAASQVQALDAIDVEPSADVATNPLPDLVVDDVNNFTKVNLRNYGVGDRPTLLWLWAPH